MSEDFFQAVFVAFQWPATLSLAFPQFTIEQLSWNAFWLHSDDMACPSKLGFQDHGFNAR